MKKVVGFVSAMLVAASLFAGGKSDVKGSGSLVVYGFRLVLLSCW